MKNFVFGCAAMVFLYTPFSKNNLPFTANGAVFYASNNVDTDIEMVMIKGGNFQMGSMEGDINEQPIHAVTVGSFYMSKHEITQSQWVRVMGENPSYFKGCDNCPVEQVSWNNVQEFIKKLNQQTGKKYRLPTEAEWEFACRAGTTTPFNVGKNLTTEQANYDGNFQYKGFSEGVYLERTTPVGTYPSNQFGLYDMHGNVWEWCSDKYDPYYYAKSPATNPTGASDGLTHVVRGGSWYADGGSCRSAFRGHHASDNRFSHMGFRLCLSL